MESSNIHKCPKELLQGLHLLPEPLQHTKCGYCFIPSNRFFSTTNNNLAIYNSKEFNINQYVCECDDRKLNRKIDKFYNVIQQEAGIEPLSQATTAVINDRSKTKKIIK